MNEQGKRVAGFDADVFSSALGGRYFSVPRGDLARTIFDTLEHDVETLFDTTIDSLHEDDGGVDVTLTNGATRRFDLVIGADGLRSLVREKCFGPFHAHEKFLGYYAASFIADEYPHRDEATYLSFARPGRQISRYAMRGGRTAFLFVFADDRRDLSAHDASAQKRILRDRFGSDGWECGEILARADAPHDLCFDAVSQIHVPSWSKGRVALVGDAAHCPSLLAGAGSAFAMLGALVLAGELHRADQHEVALGAYEERIRPLIESQQKSAVRFASSFAPKTALGIAARNAALSVMRFGPLARWYVKSSFGSAIELPSYS